MKNNVKIGDCYFVKHDYHGWTYCGLILYYRVYGEQTFCQKLMISRVSNKLRITTTSSNKGDFDRYFSLSTNHFL